MRYDARELDARARLQSDGTLLGFKQRVRSCRRWQLSKVQLDLRGLLPLGMPLRFRDPRRSRDAPDWLQRIILDSVSGIMPAPSQ